MNDVIEIQNDPLTHESIFPAFSHPFSHIRAHFFFLHINLFSPFFPFLPFVLFF